MHKSLRKTPKKLVLFQYLTSTSEIFAADCTTGIKTGESLHTEERKGSISHVTIVLSFFVQHDPADTFFVPI